MSGILFFDEACGFCTRSKNFVVRLDRTGELKTEPLQAAGAAERLGIQPSQLLDSVRWLDSSGAVYSGAEAANAALSVALGTRLPLTFYRLPGIRSLQEAVYRWVADHRTKLRLGPRHSRGHAPQVGDRQSGTQLDWRSPS